jgi:eukaryotic-like serine/threonine-protein kinase
VSDLSGELIDGRYELIRQIANGGMATIYEALDTRLDRKVAVKIMHEHLANDEEFVGRFIREAKAAAALSHPNIVAVQDQGWNQSGVPAVFLVMELVEGSTLRDYLFEKGKLTTQELLHFMSPVLSALAAAHKIGIIHRDIKPENILISQAGRVKLADFGLARGDLIGNTMTAESSVILGSVSYLSPEQVQRGVADSRSDVYSLGIVAFEALTGRKPFEGESPIHIAYQHVNETVPAPSTLNPDVPPALDDLIVRATSTNPDNRPKDGEEFLQELRQVEALLDPKRRQLSFELDLGVTPIRDKSRTPTRVSQENKVQTSERVEPMVAKKSPRESTAETARERKRRTSARIRRNRWIALCVTVAVAVGGWYVIVGPGNRVVVPSVAGMSVKEAKATLSPLGLTYKIADEAFSEDIPKGKIISSRPAGGGRISEAGTVLLFLSKGAERYTIPNLKGLTVESATSVLQAEPLVIGTTTESFDPKIPESAIISTSPVAGTKATRGSAINIVVSKGIQQLALTSYVGKTGDQALNELEGEGFIVTVSYEFSDTSEPGAVISQVPNGDSPAPKGSDIQIVVSKGSESVFVPSGIRGLEKSAAITMLENSGLVVKTILTGKNKKKFVTNISPAERTKVKRGSKVTITVG